MRSLALLFLLFTGCCHTKPDVSPWEYEEAQGEGMEWDDPFEGLVPIGCPEGILGCSVAHYGKPFGGLGDTALPTFAAEPEALALPLCGSDSSGSFRVRDGAWPDVSTGVSEPTRDTRVDILKAEG